MKGPSGESLETTENGTEGGRSGAGIGGKVRASGPQGEPPAFFKEHSQEVSGERQKEHWHSGAGGASRGAGWSRG